MISAGRDLRLKLFSLFYAIGIMIITSFPRAGLLLLLNIKIMLYRKRCKMRTTLLPFIYLWSLSTGVGGGQTSGSLVGSSSFERRGPPKWTVSFLKLARVWFISLTWSYSLTIDWRTFKWGQKIRNVYGFKNITKINFQTESGSILQIHSLPLSFSHMKRKNLHHKWS